MNLKSLLRLHLENLSSKNSVKHSKSILATAVSRYKEHFTYIENVGAKKFSPNMSYNSLMQCDQEVY